MLIILCWYPYFMSCFLVSNVPELQNPNVPKIDYFIWSSELWNPNKTLPKYNIVIVVFSEI